MIDEALKRAREQAERQQGAQRSAASRWVPAYPLARRRSRALVWTAAAAGCLLVGVAAGLVASRFAGEKEPGKEGITLPDEQEPEGAEGSSSAAGAVLLEESTDLTTDVPFPLPTTGLPPDVPLAPVPLPAPELPPPAVEEVPVEPPSPAQPSSAPPGPAAPADPPASTHTRRASIPGGGEIALGGIAFSPSRPVAMLNGKVVGVGEVIEGFTVIAIEPRRVELRGHGTTLFLSLD